jgi:hypothetical protein
MTLSVLLCLVSFMLNVVMLSVANKPFMLNVVMLSVVLLNVGAPDSQWSLIDQSLNLILL